MTSPTVREVLAEAQQQLGSDSPRLESQLLLGHTIGKSRSWLIAHDDESLAMEDYCEFLSKIEKRKNNYPIAYLLGTQEFWSMELKVTEATLIPRPETECLVEAILNKHPKNPCTILDLGTGSGAIALALASEKKTDTVIAMDRSHAAISIANENKDKHQLTNLQLFVGSWGESVGDNSIDILVSNPPYIENHDAHLPALKYEPISALTSGDDGLADIRKICRDAKRYLKSGGLIAFEHGYNQQPAAKEILTNRGFREIEGNLDLNNNPRYVTAVAP